MERFTKNHLLGLIASLFILESCYPSKISENLITGKYSSTGENEYYQYKDTIEIRATDDGKFDIQTLSYWSTPKKDDPELPKKKAGVWTNYGVGKIEVATFQDSDYTLRITEPVSGSVKSMKLDPERKTIEKQTKYGGVVIYHKID